MKTSLNIKKSIITLILFMLLAILTIALSACAPGKYETETKQPQISSPDIIQNGTLKVGIDFGNPPLAGDNVKSSGIDLDIASAIADQLGLKVEFVDVGSSAELAVENNKVDIVMGITKLSSVTEMWKSEPYINTACALYAKSSSAKIPESETSDKISTQMASPSALAAQSQYDISSVKLENSIESAFQDLSNGQSTYVAADAVIGTYYLQTSGMSANLIALLSKPSGYCIGVQKEKQKLIDAVSSALENITKGGITEAIEKRWLGKTLDLSNVPLTPKASNQADAGELDDGVYSQTDPNAPKDHTNL